MKVQRWKSDCGYYDVVIDTHNVAMVLRVERGELDQAVYTDGGTVLDQE